MRVIGTGTGGDGARERQRGAVGGNFLLWPVTSLGLDGAVKAVLDTSLLTALPFVIAFLAARSYVRQGSRMFLLFGCGMFAFGMGSLLGGWGYAPYGRNFGVTIYNMGALLGGFSHLGGVALLLLGPSARRRPPWRAAASTSVMVYSATAFFLLAVSLLASRGYFPGFMGSDQIPTLIRQVVLTFAAIAYVLSAILLVALHARTHMSFFILYSNGLFLTAIALGIFLNQKSNVSLVSWIGSASLYVGNFYFGAAVLAGNRETRIHGTSLPDYLSELFRSHLDEQVKVRTSALVQLNRRLQEEVAQRRAVEDDLRRSRDELKGVYDHSPVMMCILDANQQVLYANPAFSELVGVPQAKLIGGLAPGVFGCAEGSRRDPSCGFGFRCRECEVRRAIEDTLRTGRAHTTVEYHATLAREGTRCDSWFLGSTVRIPGRSGFNLLVSLLDITDQKRVEDVLRESESQYRTIINDSLQGFAIIQDGRIVLCNDALCRMSGYSMEETLVMSSRQILETVHPEDRLKVADGMRKIVDEGEAAPAQFTRLLTKTGDSKWVEMLGAKTMYRGLPRFRSRT